jgi:hypothetical protein
MPRTCEVCGGARRVRRQVKRSWWEAVLQRPSVVDELCGACGGIGVIRGTPEEEEAFERQRQAQREGQERKAAAEQARRQGEAKRLEEAAAARRPAAAAPGGAGSASGSYRDGAQVSCGKCGRTVSVKYYPAGQQVFATIDTIKGLALKCQDCGRVVCATCAMPAGGGGCVCPWCRAVGGPYFFTR